MKRFALYIGITAALVASCSHQEKDFKILEQDDVTFYASFEQPSEGTRVYANENLLLRWTADDRVSIFNKITYNQEYRFIGETGDYEGGFNKVGDPEFITGKEIPHVVSVYPFQRQTRVTEDEVVFVTMPAEQSYAQDSFGLGANTMVSVSTGNLLYYKNVGGYLMLKLYGEGVSVSSITLKGNNGEKLAGSASVTMPVNGDPSVEMASDATTEITLICETPVQLGATAEKSTQFWFVVPSVTFSKGFTIAVAKADGEVFVQSTSKSIVIERSNLTKMSSMAVVGGTPLPETIDLGLPSGLKWASFNLGGSKPEDYGDYYAWGEIEPYYSSLEPLTWKEGKEEGYALPSYKWCLGSYYSLTKYCWNSSYGGFVDTKTVLDPEDDAAYMALGGKWRMPTEADWTELRDNCTWECTTLNGIEGQKVTGPNGNSIFLPAASRFAGKGRDSQRPPRGSYWSSSLYADFPIASWYVFFCSDYYEWTYMDRPRGLSIRPVYGDYPTAHAECVVLDKDILALRIGGADKILVPTVLPGNAVDKSLSWSSSDESIASVSSTGVVTGLAVGTAVITVTTNDGGKTATCSVRVGESTVPVPDAVDLGLSVKWASFNLAASCPEDWGEFYAWGEIESKLDYSWSTYKWCMESSTTMTKYCSNSEYGYNGFTDTKTVLDPEDDAAYMALGGKWRMPTHAEWTELIDNCTWTSTTQDGVDGMLVTASNGNSIFLPAAGDWSGTSPSGGGSNGYYWSSSLNTNFPANAWFVRFRSGRGYMSTSFRCPGRSVRPVTD